jgi:hypothetical protein
MPVFVLVFREVEMERKRRRTQLGAMHAAERLHHIHELGRRGIPAIPGGSRSR